MSYAAIRQDRLLWSGAKLWSVIADELESFEQKTPWGTLWAGFFKTSAIREISQATTTVVIYFAVEVLPTAVIRPTTQTSILLAKIERLFGASPSDLAKILRVSRPMIYHYRVGMESVVDENRQRLLTLAELAGSFAPLTTQPLKSLLKVRQPEGSTLLEFLSEEHLNVPALRRLLDRNVREADQALRNKLAAELGRTESDEARRDIIKERHAEGRPVYVGDPENPGALIQLLPGGHRIRGRMVKRKFVPDDT